ncbi:hypothetical protein [Microvirga pakistanensis]|uniref:hypothetical protein n=1 Tax=Microvirga pakistanensis TaxID=1682650 RepID=UPI00141A731F|nr:hypothetical protein [Microvirga pakistanensis]
MIKRVPSPRPRTAKPVEPLAAAFPSMMMVPPLVVLAIGASAAVVVPEQVMVFPALLQLASAVCVKAPDARRRIADVTAADRIIAARGTNVVAARLAFERIMLQPMVVASLWAI